MPRRIKYSSQGLSDDEEDDDSGSSSLGVDELNQYQLMSLVREGQANFAIVPDTAYPKSRSSASGENYGKKPLSHPFLAGHQQFDGVYPKDNADASQNPDAFEKFNQSDRLELKPGLNYQHQNKLSQSKRSTPRLLR